MGRQNHIIRKLIIEIGLPTREEAFDIQNKLTEEYKRIILDIIEEILDRLVGEEEVITIDKLEIELGNISGTNMSDDISQKVKEEMEDTLSKLLNEVRNAPGGTADVRLTTPKGDSFTVTVSKQDTVRSEFETLVHFLQYGVFPWSNDRKEKPSLRMMIAEAMEKNPEQLRGILQQFGNKKNISRRIAIQLPADQLNYLAAIMGCSFSSRLSAILQQLAELAGKLSSVSGKKLKGKLSLDSSDLTLLLKEETITYFSSGTSYNEQYSSFTSDSFDTAEQINSSDHIHSTEKSSINEENTASYSDPVREFILHLLQRMFHFTAFITEEEAMLLAQKIPSAEIRTVFKLFVRKNNQLFSSSQKSKSSSEKNEHQKTPGPVGFSIQNQQERTETSKSEQEKLLKEFLKKEERFPAPPDAEEGIFIANAGLVILHPYLPGFFKNLGLVEGKNFVNDEAKFRALHILQWLAYGEETRTEYSEHDLVLNKLFCGIAVSEPVPVSVELSKSDKEEALVLLNAVITNWPILKNTSVRGLQITFLQKEGKLTSGDKNWELFIQRDSGVEILIDRLPWTISMIKLPWNDFMIYCTW